MKENKNNKKKMSQKGHFTQEEASQMGHDQVEGRNSVIELLEAGRDINKIFVQAGEKHRVNK